MHPKLFRIPLPFGLEPFEIASYGVMVAIGAMFGVLIGAERARRSGEKTTDVLDLALWVLIAGLVGSRILYLISGIDWTRESKSVWNVIKVFFKFRQGGLAFFGGLLLAIPVGIVFLRVRKLNVWKFADIAAPSVAIGYAFARVGCYLNGCCWGERSPAWFPLSVGFPEGSLAADFYGEANIPLYPTQFISSVNALILFFVLSFVYWRKKFDGEVFWLFCGLYAATRFLIEFLRGDCPESLLGIFTVWQGISLVLFPICVIMFLVLRARAKQKAAHASAST